MNDFLKKMFIDQAKPAMKRHSGSGGVEINKETLDVTENGTYTPSAENTYFDEVNVDVQPPFDALEITENGTHDVTEYKNAEVNIEVGVFPSGTLNITENGQHDVTNYQNTNVNVPIPDGYIKPSGTVHVTNNGTFDISHHQYVVVEDLPTLETKVITNNGTYDVKNYKNVDVNVDVDAYKDAIMQILQEEC